MEDQIKNLQNEIQELKQQLQQLSENGESSRLFNDEELEKLKELKKETEEVLLKVKEKSKENPLVAIGVAAAAGFILGKLFCGNKNE